MIKRMTEASVVVAVIDILQEVIDMMSSLGMGSMQMKMKEVMQNHLLGQDESQEVALTLITEIEIVTMVGQGTATGMWTSILEISLIETDMMGGMEVDMMTVIGILRIEITTKTRRESTGALGIIEVIGQHLMNIQQATKVIPTQNWKFVI